MAGAHVCWAHRIRTSGCAGEVSAANSLGGSRSSERVGTSLASPNIVPLTHGNYVVASAFWNPTGPNPAGAVTFCPAAGGCTGDVLSNASLTGAGAHSVGINGVTALPNGNYVVNSPNWDDGSTVDVGAVTFCNGEVGCDGSIGTTNSLIGSTAFDNVGNAGNSLSQRLNPVAVLSDGNYVVASRGWNGGGGADVGAVTFCDGTGGCTGAVEAAGSLVGSTASDRVGSATTGLANGGYVVSTPAWDNGAVHNAGAVTVGVGTAGLVGPVTAANSVLGTVTGGFMPFTYDPVGSRLLVGHPSSNTVTLVPFSTPSFRTLPVETAGPGSVTSDPAGIDCGSDCVESFPSGTTVVLTAAPAPGATFGGWTGDCTGVDVCQVTLDTDRSVSATFDADVTAPDTTITSGPPAVTNDATPTFEFTADEDGSTFTCSMDGAAFEPCTSPHTTAPLADQGHSFEVRATDGNGNTDDTPAFLAFTVDTTAPDTKITSPAMVTNDATPTFEFSADEDGATFACSVDGAAALTCSSPHTTDALGNGQHIFAVTATDAASNTDLTAATGTFWVCRGQNFTVAVALDRLLRPLSPELADRVLATLCSR
ncbi:MAG: InlB B-repeat-containing protein [Acidimicrobiales bacterium]